MKEYRTFRDFLSAIKKQADRRRFNLTRDDIDLIKTKYSDYPAFSSIDVRDALRAIEVPTKSTRRTVIGYPAIDSSTMHITDELAAEVRNILGLSAPIPVKKLGDFLSQFDSNSHTIRFDYPIDYKDISTCLMWDIKTKYVDGDNLQIRYLKKWVDKLSQLFHTNSAVVLAYLICDIPIIADYLEVLQEDDMLLIRILSPDRISPKLITKAYSDARKHLNVHKTKAIKLSQGRILALYKFVNENQNLTWFEKYKKWNGETGNVFRRWQYANLETMQVIYSRAKKKNKPLDSLRKNINSQKRLLTSIPGANNATIK